MLSRTARLAGLVAAMIGCLTVPAWGATIDDPNAARGPLDLKRLTAGKHDATAPLNVRIETYGEWPKSLLAETSENRLYILFDTDTDAQAEFTGEIVYRRGNLVMLILDRRGELVERVQVRKPERDLVRLVVPSGLPNPDGNAQIAAQMTYRAETGLCAEGCRDRIPNRGWMTVTPGQ